MHALPFTSGVGGRGKRLYPWKQRMKLLTSSAFDSGKVEDTLGMDDEDWPLCKFADDHGEDGDQKAEVAWFTYRSMVKVTAYCKSSTGMVNREITHSEIAVSF